LDPDFQGFELRPKPETQKLNMKSVLGFRVTGFGFDISVFEFRGSGLEDVSGTESTL